MNYLIHYIVIKKWIGLSAVICVLIWFFRYFLSSIELVFWYAKINANAKIYLSPLAVRYWILIIIRFYMKCKCKDLKSLDEWRTISILNSLIDVWKESKTIIHEMSLSSMNCLHAQTQVFFFFCVCFKANSAYSSIAYRVQRDDRSVLFYFIFFFTLSLLILNCEREKVKFE